MENPLPKIEIILNKCLSSLEYLDSTELYIEPK